MPADPQVEAYRTASAQIAAASALLASQTLPRMVNPAEPVTTLAAWIERIMPIIAASEMRNASISARLYEALRRSEGFTGPMPTWEPVVAPSEALRTSLYSTVGKTLQDVERYTLDPGGTMKRAQVQAAGVAMRYSMNAARNSTISATKRDPEAIGCVYVTAGDGNVCFWCSLLSSRGPVYKGYSWDESNDKFEGPGTAKSHDHCRCILVPVKSLDSARLDASKDLWTQWKAVNYDEQGRIRNSGKAALRAWRRHWEGRA